MARKGQSPRDAANTLAIKIKKAVGTALTEACILVQGTAKELCPTDQGNLRNSIQFEVDTQNLQGRVYTEVKYAPMVEYSTKAHVIKPKGKENGGADALAFEVGKKERLSAHKSRKSANIVIVKEVHHPGTTAQPFMRPALDSNRENIKKIFAKHINKLK